MAITVKAQARGLLRGTRDLLGEKSLPSGMREALETLEASLKRTWADLESEAQDEGEGEQSTPDAPAGETQAVAEAIDLTPGPSPARRGAAARLLEARNVGQWFEAEIHRSFTIMADNAFGEGQLQREERIALSSAIGDALDAFVRKLSQAAPQLYERDPYLPVQEAGGPSASLAAGGPQDGMTALPVNVVPLMERALRADGTTKVKVIEAGWGTSGYYAPDVLKRDGPCAFPAGTHMFVDHPTASEEVERPERSLKELGAVLVSDARWEDDPQGGPGLYADAKVFSDFRTVLEEMAPHIGVSINADGVVREGTVDGRKGRIVEKIRGAKSVDFVTRAGAGGKVMALYESARAASGTAGTPAAANLEEAGGMNEEELRGLREAKASADEQVARLQEALLLRDARDVAAAELAKIEMPEPTRNRLLEALVKRPTVVENKLDVEAFKTAVREAATMELEYLVAATGAGRITGMGASGEASASPEAVEKRLNEAFRDLGLSESLAERAAKGR